MRFMKVTRADGSNAYVNPMLIRSVIASEKTFSLIQFDNEHELLIRDSVDKVAELIEAAGG